MPTLINAQLRKAIPQFSKSSEIDIRITGEQEDQEESMAFLSKAMMLCSVPDNVYPDHTVQLNVKGSDYYI